MKNVFGIWFLLLGLSIFTLGCDSTSHLLDCVNGCSKSQGAKGDQGFSGNDGVDGNDGSDGVDGEDGSDGSNGHNALAAVISSSACANGGYTLLTGVDVNDDNALAGEEVQYSVEICNGTNGEDAVTGAYEIVGLIDPCGDAPGIYDEVFLKLANGTVLASFSDNESGKNTRFSILTAGNYITTDGSNCHVHVDGAGNVSW